MTFYFVREIVTYGGYFGGEIVSCTAHTLDQPDVEQSLTIDQSALTNVGGDRYHVAAGVVLDVDSEAGRITTARVVAAKERAALRKAVAMPDESFAIPRVFAHHCKLCGLWILGDARQGKCGIGAHPLPD